MTGEKITTLPLSRWRALQAAGALGAVDLAEAAVARADAAAGCRMYLDRRDVELRVAAQEQAGRPGDPRFLAGLPVSVKDLFDVAGWGTTCGSRFYGRLRPRAGQDAGYVARWRRAGALFTGKTHLNEFAWGITGENPWFGNCTIPGSPDRLTGGSSSGAAATVVAGAAVAALGTDTGGSLRVPAALCGLVSVRQSHGFGEADGVFPLAHSLDTLGWLQRHVRDVRSLALALHPELAPAPVPVRPRFALLEGSWLGGLEPPVATAREQLAGALAAAGAEVVRLEAHGWERAPELFVPIQAHEAVGHHAELRPAHHQGYDPALMPRFALGESITPPQYRQLQEERRRFVADRVTPLFDGVDFLLAPACPVLALRAGEDHAATRPRLLRLTAPVSLAGLPVLTIPWFLPGDGPAGFQVIAPHGADTRLWALAEWLGGRGIGTRPDDVVD
ncbi:MAG: amidase [Verrucomicrobiota bacterium]